MYGGLRQELGDFGGWRRIGRVRWRRGIFFPHGHMMMSIPPKYSVAQVIGYLKSAIHIAREFGGAARVTSWDSTSGPDGYFVLDGCAMSGLSESTSSSRNARIGGGISCRWIRVASEVAQVTA